MSQVWLLFLTGWLAASVQSAKIIVFPIPHRSHVSTMRKISDELQSRGHEIVIPMPRQLADSFPHENNVLFDAQIPPSPKESIKLQDQIKKLMDFQLAICRSLLSDASLITKLGSYDLVLSENIIPCGGILAHVLSLPYVNLAYGFQAIFIYKIPVSISTVSYFPCPRPIAGTGFMWRLKNLQCWLFIKWAMHHNVHSVYDNLLQELNILPELTTNEILQRAELHVVLADFILEVAQPIPPDVILVGGASAKPGNPLSQELEDFVQSSGEQGIIYVSFGSESNEMSLAPQGVQALANALSKLPFKVLWKTRDIEKIVFGNNTKILSWAPQNDILAHPQTKLFVTHCGQNGIYEALYHAVPMLACPLNRDQPQNAFKMESKGYAKYVDIFSKSEDLEEQISKTVQEVATDKRYKERVDGAARVLRSRQRSSTQTTVDWLEFVLQVKDLSHLKPAGESLPFYQLYLLDVLLFIVCVFVLLCFVCKSLVGFLFRLCRGNGEKKEHSKCE